jgi:hypothetical protein
MGGERLKRNWWRDPAISKQLNLTENERQKLDELLVESGRKMIELKSIVEKERFELSALLENKSSNDGAIKGQFKKLENMLVAISIAKKLNVDVYSVTQNLDIIQGKAGWSSQFIISLINRESKAQGLSSLRWKLSGEGDKRECVAYTKDLTTGEILEGTPVTMDMAKKEGWLGKAGSKWATMPEQMLRYRSASFYGRLYIPEILNGMYMMDEIEDITRSTTNSKVSSEVQLLNEMFIEGELVNDEELLTIKEKENV